MHSSRMRTTSSLTVSHSVCWGHVCHAYPPHIASATHAPPHCHACHPCHACPPLPCLPPPTMHIPLPHMPPPAMYTSLPCMPPYHACPSATPPLPCTPHMPTDPMHASPRTEFLTHASENITLAQLRCGR